MTDFAIEETLVLDEERDRLDERLNELADKAANADEPGAYRAIANELEPQFQGIAWLCEQHGDDAEIVIKGLTAGEMAHVEDDLQQVKTERQQGHIPGARKNYVAAAGLVAAPFYDADEQQARDAITELPPGPQKWLYNRIDDKTTVEGNGHKSFAERVAERA